MKFAFAITLLGLVGAAIAALSNPRDLVSLIQEAQKQSDDLSAGAQKILTEVRRTGLGHLDTTLVHQVKLIEDLKIDLKLALVNKEVQVDFVHIHVFQESVLQLQNDVLEQESAINTVAHEYKAQNLTQHQLVDWAQKLIKQANEVLIKGAHSHEKPALEFQLKTVQQSANDIEENKSNVGLKVEQKLALHELTIHKLETKAIWRESHRV